MNAKRLEDMPCEAAGFAMESAYLASTVMGLVEALHVMAGSAGYEDLTEAERIEIGRRAIRMVPVNIEARLGEDRDFSMPLHLQAKTPVDAMALPMELIDLLDRSGLRTIEDVKNAEPCALKSLDIVPDQFVILTHLNAFCA